MQFRSLANSPQVAGKVSPLIIVNAAAIEFRHTQSLFPRPVKCLFQFQCAYLLKDQCPNILWNKCHYLLEDQCIILTSNIRLNLTVIYSLKRYFWLRLMDKSGVVFLYEFCWNKVHDIQSCSYFLRDIKRCK